MSRKQFVCYSLMGLRRQGGLECWVPLGNYSSLEDAQSAAQRAGTEITQTRVLPYYRQTPTCRVSEAAGRAPRIFSHESRGAGDTATVA